MGLLRESGGRFRVGNVGEDVGNVMFDREVRFYKIFKRKPFGKKLLIRLWLIKYYIDIKEVGLYLIISLILKSSFQCRN